MVCLYTLTWTKWGVAWREESFEGLRSNEANHLGEDVVTEKMLELQHEEDAAYSHSFDL
jgi:hypothetical protein